MGMDIIEKLLKTANNFEYVIVGTEYFMKWGDAAPLANIRNRKVIVFVWQHIICRFSIPKEIVALRILVHFEKGGTSSYTSPLLDTHSPTYK